MTPQQEAEAEIVRLMHGIDLGANCPDVSVKECIEYALRAAMVWATRQCIADIEREALNATNQLGRDALFAPHTSMTMRAAELERGQG